MLQKESNQVEPAITDQKTDEKKCSFCTNPSVPKSYICTVFRILRSPALTGPLFLVRAPTLKRKKKSVCPSLKGSNQKKTQRRSSFASIPKTEQEVTKTRQEIGEIDQ